MPPQRSVLLQLLQLAGLLAAFTQLGKVNTKNTLSDTVILYGITLPELASLISSIDILCDRIKKVLCEMPMWLVIQMVYILMIKHTALFL